GVLSLSRLPRDAGATRQRLSAPASGKPGAVRALASRLRGRPRVGVDPEPRRPVLPGESRARPLGRDGAVRRPSPSPQRDGAGLFTGHPPRGGRGAARAGCAHRLGVVAAAPLPLVRALLRALDSLRALPDSDLRSGVVALGAGTLRGDLRRLARLATQAARADPG